MKSFALVTHWHLEAPIEAVWDALYAVEDWPKWWPYVRVVKELQRGDDSGVGAVRRYTWTSRLPYHLTFEMKSTLVERPYRLEGEAQGELTGAGAGRCVDWTRQPRFAMPGKFRPLDLG
ncbi:MAG TPA: SRPBCC family protein [Steroidobacteraceae bacterium]|jgi:uncharacterized protein YndB with AHSA1/START domain